MDDLASFVKEHPAALGIAVVLVALLAYYHSRSSGTEPTEVAFAGGGTIRPEIDPGVVAIEQSRIEAGSRNIGTLAGLILGEQQTSAALEGRRLEVDAALTSDLERTRAHVVTSLADTQSRVDIAGISALSAREIAEIGSRVQLHTANLTASAVAQEIQQRTDEARLRYNRELEQLATQRDVARVEAKSEFWSDAFGVVGDVTEAVISFFNPFD